MAESSCSFLKVENDAQIKCLSNYKDFVFYNVFNAPTYFFLISEKIKIYKMNKYLKSRKIHFVLRQMIIEQLLLAQEKYIKIAITSNGIFIYNLKPFLNP